MVFSAVWAAAVAGASIRTIPPDAIAIANVKTPAHRNARIAAFLQPVIGAHI
jgi:hypothetical protein